MTIILDGGVEPTVGPGACTLHRLPANFPLPHKRHLGFINPDVKSSGLPCLLASISVTYQLPVSVATAPTDSI